MSEKRRDSKDRILRTGESQRPDGRYAYKYTDAGGKPQFVYSWRLEPGDKLPQGKRSDLSLREKEKQIKRDLEDGINPRWWRNHGNRVGRKIFAAASTCESKHSPCPRFCYSGSGKDGLWSAENRPYPSVRRKGVSYPVAGARQAGRNRVQPRFC